jgi:NAD+ diphosphatase
LFTSALAIANWHKAHNFCSRCGSETVVEKSGWVRRCLKDGQELFPRTDPAIIASVIDSQDRILLGSQGAWEQNRWSILAGFVEPGESLSAAVVREIYEEAGIRIAEPDYLGSQSWPFPYSLMVGFTARVHPDFEHLEATPDGDEIVKLRWFSRDEIKSEAGSILLPGHLSISRAIIEHWYGGSIT